MNAIKEYINKIDATVENDYVNQITSFYSVSKLINGDANNLLSLFNANNDTALSFDDYQSGLVGVQFNKLNRSASSADEVHSYSQDVLDYQTFLATIARLQADHSDKFIKYLQNKINAEETTAYLT
jgi:hypothetical protein